MKNITNETYFLNGIPGYIGNIFGPSPAISTDNAIVRWDGITAIDIQNSIPTINDTGSIQNIESIDIDTAAINPGGSNTIWINSSDGDSIYKGSVNLENSGGDFFGPASSTDNALVRFDGATGKLGQNSTSTLSDSGVMLLAGRLNIPDTSGADIGVISIGGTRHLHNIGTRNFFLGENSANFVLTGSDNYGLGYQSLNSLTNGSGNIAIGSNSLVADTTGRRNVAIGSDVLYSNLIGNNNVGVGYNSLLFCENDENVCIGSDSGGSISSGRRNTGVGTNVLESVETGENNIALGYFAGASINSNGTDIICIGNSGSGSINGDIRIGNSTQHLNTYIQGIHGVNDPASPEMVIIDSTGKMGSQTIPVSSGGDFVGPSSSTNDALVRFNGTTGKLGQDSTTTLSDGGILTLPGRLSLPVTTNSSTGVINFGNQTCVHAFGANNIFLGASSGNLTTTGSSNTGCGVLSMDDNTTGSWNTALGSQSLLNNTTGFANTSVGMNSLRNNLTGNYNTGIGYNSLYDTTGNYNVAIGSDSGKLLTTGEHNICIDNQGVAGEAETIRIGTTQNDCYIQGIHGVTDPSSPEMVIIDSTGKMGSQTIPVSSGGDFVGPASSTDNALVRFDGATGKLGQNSTATLTDTGILSLTGGVNLPTTTGSDVGTIKFGTETYVHSFGTRNLFLGENSGNMTMTGSNNTACGALSFIDNTTGYSNTAVGSRALESNTTGLGNTAIGDVSLAHNLIGEHNTAIGLGSLDFSTGSNNIAIGSSAGVLLETGDNNIYIGNQGDVGDDDTIRIGTAQTDCYVKGIFGVTDPSSPEMVIIDSTGKLGSQTIPSASTSAYGGMLGENNWSISTIFTSLSTDFSNKSQVLAWGSAAPNSNCTVNIVNGTLTPTISGDYVVYFALTLQNNSNKVYSAAIFKNSGATKLGGIVTQLSNSAVQPSSNLSLSQIVSLTAGEDVGVYVQCENGNTSLQIEDKTFNIFKL
jgi:hypothetical protein